MASLLRARCCISCGSFLDRRPCQIFSTPWKTFQQRIETAIILGLQEIADPIRFSGLLNPMKGSWVGGGGFTVTGFHPVTLEIGFTRVRI